MIELFSDLELDNSLVSALQIQGITIPTEVQKNVIPQVLKNKDLVVQSDTGTGKTLAFLLPLFEKIDASKKEMQALILVPTHELAIQILRQIESLSENSEIKVSSTSAIGNVNIQRQIDKLREKPHIIVGSPGRILELIKKKKLSAHTIKTIIIDEADTLLDDSNIYSIKAVIKTTYKDRQLLMFSATITKKTQDRAKEFMNNPEMIKEKSSTIVPDTIDHAYILVENKDKISALKELIDLMKPKKAMVFIGEREEAEICTKKLQNYGIKADGIHGQNQKMDRKKAMDDFKSGKIQVLVASDIAARGIDIKGVTHIFNLSLPEKSKDYLHRVGRTGRNGNKGIAISIIKKNELHDIGKFEKDLNIKINDVNK